MGPTELQEVPRGGGGGGDAGHGDNGDHTLPHPSLRHGQQTHESTTAGIGGGNGAAASGTKSVAAGGGKLTMRTRLAALAGFSGVAISAVCIGLGHGLTPSNFASLHVSLAGLFVAARAANMSARGSYAKLAQAIATIALAIVAQGALRQVSRGGTLDPEELTHATAKMEVVKFWGLASVAGYLTTAEALPVLLEPLHSSFRMLERTHNVLLSLASLGMLIGITVASVSRGKMSGLHAFLCMGFEEDDAVFNVTSSFFFWSKAWEWFDTALLVAKGKRLSWLHYTHHASTALLTALNTFPTPNGIWPVACSTNCFVHTWMYGYYAFPRSPLLRRSRVWLTRAQILQHVTVLTSSAYVAYLLHSGAECHNTKAGIYAALSLYLMYLVFFSVFYKRTYGSVKKSKGS